MRLAEMLRGFAAKLVLDRLAGDARIPRPSRHRLHVDMELEVTVERGPLRRGPLFMFMMACAGIGVPLMIIFEAPITRIVGVLALFGFIVAGVFVIADPAFLAGEEEGT